MPAPEIIHQLVQRFEDNLPAYRSGHYNETQLRQEFLNPFFEALGWDVFNKQGYAEAYKDVVHEDAIKVSGGNRAPDYCFRAGGTRKFFVEAKKPSVNIKEDISPTFQLRRYAWSAKLPLSILTDFEEFAVFDCRSRPDRSDKPSTGRLMMLTFREYLEKWDEIAAIFSREAVLKGSFDRYAEAATGKRGTAEVDDAFLAEIERWRDLLSRNIALRNPQLNQRELNYAVQMTIDRIIFLRIAEDRGIEPAEALRSATRSPNIYANLIQLFQRADQRYNSGLFHFHAEKEQTDAPDKLTPSLVIDDKPLKDILGNLYYPDSPYEFSVLPADILGQVYEQFLGKVIRLTAGHHAIVEDKPEVKKAGGVFYTPTYIVDYIVKHTLGALLEDKKPGEKGVGKGEPLRVLDPACGSGSFLLGAYQYLLDWYRDGYIADDPQKWAKGAKPRLVQSPSHAGALPAGEGRGGGWQLTTLERKRILLDHIYGVDIDPQAVEVTKLSLLLKVLEGENEQTIGKQLSLFQERALPDLGGNIQCGNSLIGPDFYQGQQASFLDMEEQYRINAFDWGKAFPQVFKDGGFDAVIGNPPYVRQEGLRAFKEYFQSHYKVYHGMADLYAYFIERGLSFLKPRGIFGYIVANKWLRTNYGEPLRVWMKNFQIIEITDFGDLPVFERATTYPCILILQKENPSGNLQVTNVQTLDFISLSEYQLKNYFSLNQDSLFDKGWSLSKQDESDLLNNLRKVGIELGTYINGKVFYGIKTGLNEAFVIDASTRQELIDQDSKSIDIIKPFLIGREVKRYQPPKSQQFIILIPKGWTRERSENKIDAWRWLQNSYPAIARHLAPFTQKGENRYDKGEYWWELRACDYYDEFEKPKIIYPNISKKPQFTYDTSSVYTNQKCFIIPTDSKYLLGVLNSKVTYFLYRKLLPKLRGDFYEPSYVFFKEFPIRPIDFTNPADVQRHERILTFHQQLALAQTPTERSVLQRQIDATDHEIDRLVYELYELSEEEIRIVEGK